MVALPPSPPPGKKRTDERPPTPRKSLRSSRRLIVTAFALAGIIFAISEGIARITHSDLMKAAESTAVGGVHGGAIKQVHQHVPYEREFDEMQVLNFPRPQASIWSQLKKDVRYLMAGGWGGHANQFIAIYHLLYLAKVSSRVAIITTLIPLHFQGYPQDFSMFFDLHRFRRESGILAIEMSKLKEFQNDPWIMHTDEVSCWSIGEGTTGGANPSRDSMGVHKVRMQHWPLPRDLARGSNHVDFLYEGLKHWDWHWWSRQTWYDTVRAGFLPQIDQPEGVTVVPSENMKDAFDTPNTSPPSDQLYCYDQTFFVGSVDFPEPYKIEDPPMEPLAPREEDGWIHAGQHIHFNKRVESLTNAYLMRIFGVRHPNEVPPFISVHMRRGDFLIYESETPYASYVTAVEKVRAKLQERMDRPGSWRGPSVKVWKRPDVEDADDLAVVVTTDERDEAALKPLRELGWLIVDHTKEKTEKKLGGWWPSMIDSSILARGIGFVGTHRSTFSDISALRVKYWQGGVFETAMPK